MSVEIIPGEMRLWTDRASALRPPAGGAAVLALLESVKTDGDVLVLGPHDDDVLAPLTGRPVTVVVRSLTDAEEIAARHDVEVVCGDYAEFCKRAGRTWDLVVALDGLDRVASNDWPTPPWADRFALLGPLVSASGRLLLAVDNPSSALSLADARPLAERRETGDWEPPAALDRTRPRTVADLPAGTLYAGAWAPSAPGVLVAPSQAGDVRVRSALGRALAAVGDRELLLDPLPYVAEQIAAGRFADVATSWVVVTGPPPAYEPFPGEPPAGELVADRAVALAQAEDLAGLRALMKAYLPEATAFPDATLESGETLAPDEATPTAAATWLARRLLAPDVRRIWPRWLDAGGVARSLAAMAGTTLDDAPVALPPLPVVDTDLRSLRAVNETLRGELEALRGELFAQRRLIENRDRQLERRTGRLHEAELRAARAEAVAETHARSLPRRVMRAARNPRRALGAIRRRLRSR
jgi:hypothetical protein